MEAIIRDPCAFRFDNYEWRFVSRDELANLGIWPNRIAFNKVANAAALVVAQSAQYAEFALSESGLYRVRDGLEGGKVVRADVALVKGMAVLRRYPVLDVVATVKGVSPREGRFGPYWWLNLDGSVNDSGAGAGDYL